jgi:pyrroline-5-carboxylate reductase
MDQERNIGFIGAGNMTGAIVKGLVAVGKVEGGRILIHDVAAERMEDLASRYGVTPVAGNEELCRRSQVVVLAVKPQAMGGVLKEIGGMVDESKLLVSIAAGISLFKIESRLRQKTRLIRVMPNAPLLVGKGMSAMTCGSSVREEDRRYIQDLFGTVGRVVEVDERQMDAVTALSGSGPAYVFLFLEALADAGVKIGLSRSQARLLAVQTVRGSAEMALADPRHLMELKDLVTSPGGTTIHALHRLEAGGVRGAVISAVEAAWLRARELGEE